MTSTAPATDEGPLPLRGLIAAIAAISVVGIGFGHSLPLFSLLLEQYGASDAEIGLVAAMPGIAALICGPFYPRMMTALGLRPFLVACLVAMAFSYAALLWAGDNVPLWYPLRFIFGVATAGVFTASEVWINRLAPKARRGQIIGIYATCLALGFAIGPLLILAVGIDGAPPFIVGMIVFAAAAIPAFLAPSPPKPEGDSPHGFLGMIPKAPATFMASAVFAGVEAAMLTFLPILAVERDWGSHIGAQAITVYGLGIVVFQYAIGRWADRIGYTKSLFRLAFAGTVGGVLLALTAQAIVPLFIVLFVWAGIIAGLYTVGLTLIGDRFAERDVGPANAGFVFMYAAGAIVGPASAGLIREVAGPAGLNIFLIGALALYTALIWARRHARLP